MKSKRFLTFGALGLIASAIVIWNTSVRPVVAEPDRSPKGSYQLYLPLVIKQTGAPVINSFTATPSSITVGGTSQLAWNVTGATSLSITPGIGTITDTSINVSPSTTTEYTLTATNSNGSTTAKTTVAVTSGSTSAAFWLPYNTLDNSIVTTYGTSVAVDAAGGIHVAYAIYTGTDNGAQPAYYIYCAANCNNIANWTRTRLSNNIQDVRLALDPAGHPRLMLFTHMINDLREYRYAACDVNCTNSANWSIVPLIAVNDIAGRRSYYNNRYFAVDTQGRPAMVYADKSNGHSGTFYAQCVDNNCMDLANWADVMLAQDEWWTSPSLAFTPSGGPRIAFGNFVWSEARQQYVTNLWFIGCDTTCYNQANWNNNIKLADSMGDGDSMVSLRIDNLGRPRLALYTGNYVSQPLQPYKLFYIWCNTSCFSQASSDWGLAQIGSASNQGDGVDLTLDANNRPRMAYELDGTGLGYAYCNTNCESNAGTWTRLNVEATSVIQAQYPSYPPYSCPIQTWFNGKRPSLAFDAAGNPRIGYDAERWWGGYYANGTRCEVDVPVSRFTLFSQP